MDSSYFMHLTENAALTDFYTEPKETQQQQKDLFR
jgi:hypothetical protein